MSHVCKRIGAVSASVLLAFGLCFGMVGCQSEGNTNTEKAETMVIGEQTSNTYTMSLSNSAGKSVTSMVWRVEGTDTFSSNMMSSDKRLANGETATICIPKGTITNGEYFIDLKVVFSDGSTSTLHHLDLEDFESCTLLLKGKVGYVTYQSKAGKRMVSTLELQVYYYNLEDPEAEARDKAEEEEEKRRLEKLEEDLKSAEEETANTTNSSNTSSSTSSDTSNSNEAANNEVQGSDVEDVPLEDFDSDGREYFDGDSDSDY